MDRAVSMTGVYTNPVQAGEETDFWSRPLHEPERQEPQQQPVANPFEQQQAPAQPQQQLPNQGPVETTPIQQQPQQQQPENNEQLQRLQAEIYKMQAERNQEQNQRQYEEQQRKFREERRKALNAGLQRIDANTDWDDDQKQAAKQVLQDTFDGVNRQVDSEFQQYGEQVKGVIQTFTGPLFVAQTLQQAGLPVSMMNDVMELGIPPDRLQQALPYLKRMAEERNQRNQNQASEENQQQQAAGVNQVSGYGESAPTGQQVEPGSDEHLAQLLVGF